MNNKIVFGMPEILVAGSFFLLISGLIWQGWMIFVFGLFGSLVRFSLEIQKAKLAEEKQKEVVDRVENFGKTFAEIAAIGQAFGNKNDGKLH